MTVHGEAPVAPYSIAALGGALVACGSLVNSRLHFEGRVRLADAQRSVLIAERVENLSNWYSPVAWTQHVTLGPPFLERGKTRFEADATRSKVYEGEVGKDGYMRTAAEF